MLIDLIIELDDLLSTFCVPLDKHIVHFII